MSGNNEYPGIYFYSDPSDPLKFNRDMRGVLSSTENITAFSKQYSDLLIFTDNSVSRMRYNFTSDSGGYFSVHLINSQIGCDVPKSVCTVENRTVFANSDKGVFIVDSTDSFDVLNIMSISKNIVDHNGEKGYFAVEGHKRKNAVAQVSDGKYMLSCKGVIFVWDFGISGYVSSSNYRKIERELSWFELEDPTQAELIFRLSDNYYGICKDENGANRLYKAKNEESELEYVYKSDGSYLSSPFDYKYVHAFYVCLDSHKSTELQVTFIADGKPYYTVRKTAVPHDDAGAFVHFTVPKYICKSFGFEIRLFDCNVGISNLGFDYIVRRKY